jgi:dipeptidase D
MDVLDIFKKICAIPHCSFKTEKLRDYIEDFCLKAGCFVEIDTVGNIIARKGYPEICLQAHYDMVCVGKAPKIDIYEEDGFLKAKNSSLGADNGMGVALMLQAAEKYDNIELLFTNDEEVGMIGAKNLQLKIKAKKILNLDTEEGGKVFIGCAGGVDIDAIKRYVQKTCKNCDIYKISVTGLPGGHSGVDIDKHIPNAIKELGFYLKKFYPGVISINAGEARNSIPKSAEVFIAVQKGSIPPDEKNIIIEKTDLECEGCFNDSKEIIDMICGFANGVRGYDKELQIPTESVNLSKIQTINDTIVLNIFPRADDDNLLERLKSEIASYFANLGFETRFSNQYSGWKPEINDFSKDVYNICKEEFENVSYAAIHAGLECGVLLEKFADKKMIASIGPTIYNPHSIHEKCEIGSVFKIEKIIDKLIKK